MTDKEKSLFSEDFNILKIKMIDSLLTKADSTFHCKTISDMKTNSKISIGSIVKTFGYYTFGDGGGAEYTVVSNTGNTGDDVVLFDLPNTLQAKLIHNGNIKAEQIGLKKDVNFDNAPLIVKAISGNIKDIYFPRGNYQFNELLITYNTAQSITGTFNLGYNVRLHGVSDLTFDMNVGARGTVFSPFTTNQRFIVKFGGLADFSLPASALQYDVNNVGLIDVSFDDTAKPTINGCLCLEYIYSSAFSVAFFNNVGRSLYIKNCWELDFEKLIIRQNKTKLEAVYIDDVINDAASNTSRIYFKEVDLEGLSGTFLKTGMGANCSNIMIDTLSYEHSFVNAYTNVLLPSNLTNFQGYTKIPLFDLGFVDGLSIGQMNLCGMSKKYFTDGTTNYTDSIFKLNSFFNISVGIINVNDSGAYIQLADGAGDLHSILKVNSITSSKRNRLWYDDTLPVGELLMFSSVVLGGVIIPSNSFKEKDDTSHIHYGKMYAREELLKLTKASKKSISLAYDSLAINSYALKRVVVDFQTILTMQLTDSLRCRIRIKTDQTTLQIQTRDVSDATLSTTNYTLSGSTASYQEVEFVVKKDSNATTFRIIVPIAGTVCFIDYLYVAPLSIVQSANAVALANGNTITTLGVAVARVNPTSAVTGIILQAGIYGGQEVAVINEAISANSVTFAASSSNVADGSSAIIGGATAKKFIWDSVTNLWYRTS